MVWVMLLTAGSCPCGASGPILSLENASGQFRSLSIVYGRMSRNDISCPVRCFVSVVTGPWRGRARHRVRDPELCPQNYPHAGYLCRAARAWQTPEAFGPAELAGGLAVRQTCNVLFALNPNIIQSPHNRYVVQWLAIRVERYVRLRRRTRQSKPCADELRKPGHRPLVASTPDDLSWHVRL
jgi:hypothetical protein